jgi:hypothetical protein
MDISESLRKKSEDYDEERYALGDYVSQLKEELELLSEMVDKYEELHTRILKNELRASLLNGGFIEEFAYLTGENVNQQQAVSLAKGYIVNNNNFKKLSTKYMDKYINRLDSIKMDELKNDLIAIRGKSLRNY